MKNKLLILSTVLFTGCNAANQTPNVDLYYGIRDFETSEQWEQTDKHDGVIGIEAQFAGKNSFGPEFGFNYSSDGSQDPQYVNRSTNRTTSTVAELYVGARKNWMINNWWQVYLSGGISAIRSTIGVGLTYTEDSYQDRETNYAPYIHVGTKAYVNDNCSVGAGYRQTFINEHSDILSTSPQLDSGLFLLSVGYTF